MAYNTASELERYMAELVNAERAKVGLDPLRIEQNLNEAAELHSEWMLNANVFSHTGKGGSVHEDRIRQAGFDMSGKWGTGENIALYSVDGDGSFRDEVQAMMEGLMNSPGHKANILRSSFDYIGVGIELGYYTQGGQTHHVLIATQDFGATSGKVLLDEETGTAATDRISGTSTADILRGAGGNDTISGGAGQDVLEGQGGNDRLKGGSGGDELDGGAGRDVVLGGGGQDFATGGTGKDTVKGGKGGDIVKGGGGGDKLFGQAGNDRLDGGAGRDVMTGGAGRDTFVFREGCGADRVTDFDASKDRIALDDALWAGFVARAEVVDRFATETSRGVLFDFDGSDSLLLRGLDSVDGLESLITLI